MTVAVILAGGESSRLKPLGDKSLQKFMGVSLLQKHMRQLIEAGITACVVVTNPQNTAATQAELLALQPHIAISYTIQDEQLGMGDAVKRALKLIDDTEAVYITQAHDLFREGFHTHLLAEAGNIQAELLLTGTHMSEYFPGGYFLSEEDPPANTAAPFRVSGIVEKPGAGNEPSHWVTLVAHWFASAADLKTAMAQTEGGALGDHYERALAIVMQEKRALVIPHTEPSASLKYPWHMLDIMELLLGRISGQHISPQAQISNNVTIQGNVIIEPGVRMFPGSGVLGPAYIGAGAIIGNGALARSSMIGAQSVIGYGTEVARSWIGENVWFHTNYVGDSVIDDNVSFGSGTVTGNLRLDEGVIKAVVKGERIATGRVKLGQIIGSGTRIGINASLMPGIIIGRNTFVGPAVLLNQNVPDEKRVTLKQELEWGENSAIKSAEDRKAFRSKL